ncbi:hypothetical protein M8C21_014409 [Ambrosia artemisiifolia]|uniref:Uncharacterized protein n=1 Tax=Ambrosia artemisiifolia TaxID=4212 RepID=A0AAD5C936_AMBAR|nr:hypothetical protein M8C21_014409 [Ambrosia artemisiifolia]
MEQITSQIHSQDLNMKATELRLGLPGSESPERTINAVKNLVSGAKRGFSDTWGLSNNDGYEDGFVKNGGFVGENKNSNYVKGDHVASSLSSTKHFLDDNHSQDSLVALK